MTVITKFTNVIFLAYLCSTMMYGKMIMWRLVKVYLVFGSRVKKAYATNVHMCFCLIHRYPSNSRKQQIIWIYIFLMAFIYIFSFFYLMHVHGIMCMQLHHIHHKPVGTKAKSPLANWVLLRYISRTMTV